MQEARRSKRQADISYFFIQITLSKNESRIPSKGVDSPLSRRFFIENFKSSFVLCTLPKVVSASEMSLGNAREAAVLMLH
eukprot:scaffold16396_cov140-Cylindrotheca_fusiformis.AAC.5